VYVRLRFDIGWGDLASAFAACLAPGRRARRQQRLEALASGGHDDVIACLSARSAFDLYLAALALPAGSEVIMTAVNVPDMARIVASHGLVPVPVDIDDRTLGPPLNAIARAASPRTRLVLVAHLFGAKVDIAPIVALARRHGWLMAEDCAQSFAGLSDFGARQSDASFFSFGPIKTSTALAGGMARVTDARVRAEMRRLQAAQPARSRLWYAGRIGRFALLKALAWPPVYRLFVGLCRAARTDHDRLVQSAARGFPGGELLRRIRRQAPAPLLATLERRLRRRLAERIEGRVQVATALAARLPDTLQVPGLASGPHVHWVFPVIAQAPEALVRSLRRAGFDATSRSSLAVLLPPPAAPHGGAAPGAERLLEHIVFVPAYPELPPRARERLGRLLSDAAASDS
jgi:dTDP-4-amino-4,6-dideoxygalactose transaminase